jgi:hypothetical protein
MSYADNLTTVLSYLSISARPIGTFASIVIPPLITTEYYNSWRLVASDANGSPLLIPHPQLNLHLSRF